MSQTSFVDNDVRDRSWRDRWYEVIFEADTPAGKMFDVLLLVAILASVLVVMLESVESIRRAYPLLLWRAELLFTGLFTLEYFARIVCARRPLRYIFSFYGLVDLLAVLPTYLTPFFAGERTQRLAVIRALRLLRAFRIFKLAHMLSEASALREAVWSARAKIAVFLSTVLIAVVIVGSAMHLIEGDDNPATHTGFDSVPESMYWAIVTMTTVGYGDVSPTTAVGKLLAAGMMVLGYCMIIVPTGIVSAELAQTGGKIPTTVVCGECMAEGHDRDAVHCKFCGGKL
ncbi:MAG: ion transporter [Planctomycetota bacterium]|nr:MAG: ion transporter [Planctomycetota bacterium]REJ96087.1 MAG: ion transporter [Planctomycetota bacterium]REK21859.1 MAG: ion transporter [Planctomycetota bacterium]REK46667.1 MAG: ion transporter [Planctomycetota bacterium]